MTWTNTIAPTGTGAASGSFAFSKTITVAAGTVGSGSLADTVTLTPGGQSAQTANASVSLTANAADPKLRFTKTVDLAPGRQRDVHLRGAAPRTRGGSPPGRPTRST